MKKEKGLKYDDNKDDYSLLPPEALRKIVRVLTDGKFTYGRNNWKLVEDYKNRYYSAALRHLEAWRMGEEYDPQSFSHHLAHCACNVIFLLQKYLEEQRHENNH